jgi:hypothetical protein
MIASVSLLPCIQNFGMQRMLTSVNHVKPTVTIPLFIALFAVGLFGTGCTSNRYTVLSRGYKIEQRAQSGGDGALLFSLDSNSGNNSVFRMMLKNIGTRPVVIDKRTANLMVADTIISTTPLADDAYTEYSFHASSVTSSVSENSTMGVNPYAFLSTERLAGSSKSSSFSATNGTTVTKLASPEVVIYPNQVLSLYLNNPIEGILSKSATYTYRDEYGNKVVRQARINNSSDDEYLIDRDITTLQKLFSTASAETYTLTLSFRVQGDPSNRFAQSSFGIRDVDVNKRVETFE